MTVLRGLGEGLGITIFVIIACRNPTFGALLAPGAVGLITQAIRERRRQQARNERRRAFEAREMNRIPLDTTNDTEEN